VPYFAVALARKGGQWTGQEIDLDDVGDLDGVTDTLRDMIGEGGGPALMFLEENDEYMLAVRVDGVDDDADPRSFISDIRAVETSELAAKLYDVVTPEPALDLDDDSDEESAAKPEGEPGGDDAIVVDLGTPAQELLDLCSEEGNLPADVIYAVCERAGCGELLEELRGA
jgi:putative tRNA adenosine deaminase-associated protein